MSKLKTFIQLLLFGIGSVVFLSACNSSTEENGTNSNNSTNERIQIVTTIAQIGEPIQLIGGERVEVQSLMGPGVDPHLYEATQGDITTLQNAEVIFYNGLHLEGNMTDIFAKLEETKTTLALGESIDESRLLEDEEGAIDPHIWFDLDIWKDALNNATEILKEYSPDDAGYFEQNKQDYFAKIDELKADASEKLSSISDEQRVLVTAHDAFGYFGRMYDIEVIGLQGLSTEDEVGLSDIQSTVDLLIEKQVPSVFVESSINQNSIKAVIEGAAKDGLKVDLGGELFSDAMGDAGTEEGTYLGMYRHNVETIYKGLSGGGN
ncbi:metal ABC transporter solute-binding protein, Zn/Mn family [Lysinibacillus sp. SGAir0095]|uniref:metal ABC transporter solute-binding protein, Zn/Mn family n=1 Tax=Lysinibacillus sp. SGAir0095 TaxID=2070463 RepID=UPI0010CD2694|nr:zinc ABC transporter substrate-binding protein [Lysinibacillus sp. SGAir0095]QCR33845.1 manganese transporter [Lysinibacillus sp. SGAir0095]